MLYSSVDKGIRTENVPADVVAVNLELVVAAIVVGVASDIGITQVVVLPMQRYQNPSFGRRTSPSPEFQSDIRFREQQ